MKEALIRRWAHAPWHCWIKEQPRWVDIFAELWARLPEDAVKQLVSAGRELIVLPPPNQARVVRVMAPLLTGASIVQLDAQLLNRPRDEVVAILAHEFAHLCTMIAEDELKNDLAADHLVRVWGFENELRQALARDLEGDHPRVLALAS